MDEVQIFWLEKNIIKISNCAFNSRLKMKFNILLNAYKDISINKDETSYTLDFKASDVQYIADVLKVVIDFLSKNKINVDKDDYITEIINENEKLISTHISTLENLKQIKSDSIESDDGFNNFCSFCDSCLAIKLRAYQYKAAYILVTGNGGFDFSVPGAGKTIITYAAYNKLKYDNKISRIFIIGPKNSYNAWFDEYTTCFNAEPEFENLADCEMSVCKAYLNSTVKNHKEISFINIDKVRTLENDIKTFIASENTLLVVDEAHKIKNPNAQSTVSVLEITKSAYSRIVLTGTPMPNGYEDIYTLSKVYSPYNDIVPFTFTKLKNLTKNDSNQSDVNRLRESLSPYYSRISKKFLLETKELLPPVYHVIKCDMDANQEILYDSLNSFIGKMSDNIDEDLLSSLKKAILIRKMQISANPVLLKKSIINSMDELKSEYCSGYDEDEKETDALVESDNYVMSAFDNSGILKIVNSFFEDTTSKNRKAVEIAAELVNQKQKVLIWDVFVVNMNVLKAMLESSIQTKVELINGTVSNYDRQTALKNFRDGDSMILLANPATLAESISLHKVCQNAIYVNRNFNAAQFIQSKDRIHRINMPKGKTANYYFLVNSDSVDEVVDEKLIQKENRMLRILDSDELEVGGSDLEDTSTMSIQDIEDGYKR